MFITPGAQDQLCLNDAFAALVRHMCGDWGLVHNEVWHANDEALNHGSRIHSSFVDRRDQKFWVITEADRSATIILLPDEC